MIAGGCGGFKELSIVKWCVRRLREGRHTRPEAAKFAEAGAGVGRWLFNVDLQIPIRGRALRVFKAEKEARRDKETMLMDGWSAQRKIWGERILGWVQVWKKERRREQSSLKPRFVLFGKADIHQ